MNLSMATLRPAVACVGVETRVTVMASNFVMTADFGKEKISVSSVGDVMPGL